MESYDNKDKKRRQDRESGYEHVLILHNDDLNTFENVIDALVTFCDHNNIQAEQCATIAHYLGSCEVKRGTLLELLEIHKMLTAQSLKVSIHQLIGP